MASNRIRLNGLKELFEGLRNLPTELRDEAAGIVFANAEAAKEEIVAAYPRRTGNLKSHVSVKRVYGQFSTSAIVKNTAKHAFLFENGTQARHTDLGANRGAAPPGHVFIPIMIRRRRVMYEVLKDLLVRKGLTVSGHA